MTLNTWFNNTWFNNTWFHKKRYHNCLMILVLFKLFWMNGCSDSTNTIRIGCKNFTEQIILGEMIAHIIEAKTDRNVERLWNLGGTMICHQAMINGRIDIYPEYTGTGYINILNQTEILPPEETLEYVRTAYETEFQATWLNPFGFSNSYTMTVRQDDAIQHGWENISDLNTHAQQMRAGFTSEFSERQDGYPSFKKHYGFAFSMITDLDPGLMYSAIQQGQIDVISAFSTDGRIPAYKLKVLKDDKQFFPPYDAAPVVRLNTLQKYPMLETTLHSLYNVINQETMQKLNQAVDAGNASPASIAKEFLEDQELL